MSEVQYGMLPPGTIPVEGENLRKWASGLPTYQSIRTNVNLERKQRDESSAVNTISSALREFNCTLLPVVVMTPDQQIHAWMHVYSYLTKEPGQEQQAAEDQTRCKEYIEAVLRNYDVRFEFLRNDKEESGFEIQVLTNW